MARNGSVVPTHEIRGMFASAMSEMYQREVPLYGDLLRVVNEINEEALKNNPELRKTIGELRTITAERHGAIRLGLPKELHTMRRLFAVMGMHPVDYYDLTVADLPVHSTAFRPIAPEELDKQPFRMFTSLLRLDLLEEGLRERAETQLQKRNIFSDNVIALITKSERNGGLTKKEAREFVAEAVKTFQWHKEAAISKEFYQELLKVSGLVADIVGFKGPHINHLTPRVLNIDELQHRMETLLDAMRQQDQHIGMIAFIQGPPQREADILLRQTSFQALNEPTKFPTGKGTFEEGRHRARFGEIEARGIALTQKGRALYDSLTTQVEEKAKAEKKRLDLDEKDPEQKRQYGALYSRIREETFRAFPDGYDALFEQSLAYFRVEASEKGLHAGKRNLQGKSIPELVKDGYLTCLPVTYEDFLPVSAAGIFKSNLVEGGKAELSPEQKQAAGRKDLEKALGCDIIDPFAIYEALQARSIKAAFSALDVPMPQSLAIEVNRSITNDPVAKLHPKGNGR